jgi:hypothetical protein
MLGFIPGLLHAWYIIAKFPDTSDYERIPTDAEGGRVTYVYVQPGVHNSQPQGKSVRKPQPGYGTAAPVAPPVHQEASGAWSTEAAGEGSSSNGAAPPSYAQAVKGDHKVQTQD